MKKRCQCLYAHDEVCPVVNHVALVGRGRHGQTPLQLSPRRVARTERLVSVARTLLDKEYSGALVPLCAELQSSAT